MEVIPTPHEFVNGAPKEEIDLHGMTVDEAIPRVDNFLYETFRSGYYRVWIIHGKGTGKLRQSVREMLSHHPHVKSYESGGEKEGGEGVTVAKLHA